jgi:hypothetical protein
MKDTGRRQNEFIVRRLIVQLGVDVKVILTSPCIFYLGGEPQAKDMGRRQSDL